MANPITERIVLVPLPAATERAQRMLDGGSYNREKIGQDVLAPARECEHWRAKNAADVAAAEPASFGESFAEIFKKTT